MAALRPPRALALLAFALLWHVAIDAGAWPWLRLLLALALFSVPGVLLQRLVLRDAAGRVTRQATLGFALSTTLTGALGLIACLLHLPFAFVNEGLFTAGALLLLVAPLPERPRLPRAGAFWLACLPALAALALASRLAIAPYVGDDDIAHMARIRYFASSSALGFEDFIFGTGQLAAPRYWLSFWPLANAVFTSRAGITPLELLALYLSPILAVLALVALYELALSLGASQRLAAFAVVAQVAALLLTPSSDQPGGVFFNRLAEDKAAAAFLIAPIFLRLVAEALERPARRALVALALAGAAQVFAHPTILGMTCAIAALYVILELAVRRERAGLLVLAIVLFLPVVPASFRFLGIGAHHLQFSIGEAQEAGELGDNRIRRLTVAEDGRYAVSPELYHDLPFVMVGAAAALALFRVRRDPCARLVLAAALLILSTLTPWSAALLGKAVTPFQIWRLLWLTPFGLSAALLASAAASLLPALPPLVLGAAQLLLLALSAGYALNLPGRMFQAWPLPERWRTVVYSIEEDEGRADRCVRTFDDFRAIGAELDRLSGAPAIAAGDRDTNHFLPTLSARARPFVFRTEVQSMLHGGFTREEAAARFRDWETLIGKSATPEERLQVVERRALRFLLACGDAAWVRKTQAAAPGRLRKAAEFGALRLFEVK